MRATGSAAWRWRSAPSSSIPIIPGGTGTPTSTTPTAGATTAAPRFRAEGRPSWPLGHARRAGRGLRAARGARGGGERPLRDLLKLRPDFAATARKNIEKWWEPAYVERLIDGRRKAGLEIGASAAGQHHAAVAIAVLPFSDMSAARDQEYLCEGMAEEIMNALVRIDGIRIASRTSAFRARSRRRRPAPRSPARFRSATSSKAACARRAAGFASPRS